MSLPAAPIPSAAKTRLALLAVLAAAGLRALHLWVIFPLELGQDPLVGMDRWLSMHIASAIADGKWLGGWSAPYDSSPGYSYPLAVVYWLSGRRWLGPLTIQVILGALVPLLLYDVGSRLFDTTVGLLAAWLAALYGPFLFYETLLVKYAVLPFTVALALVSFVRARESLSHMWAALAGGALGALLLLRPNAAIVVPVMVLWMAAGRRQAAVGLLVAALLGMAAVLGPMAVHDEIARRQGVASSLWGLHFYIGTNPHADGAYVPVARVRDDVVGHIVDARRIAEERAGRGLTPADVSWFWFRRGVRFVRHHPGAYLRIQARKTWLALHGDELGSFGEEFHDLRRASWVLHLPLVSFGAICPFGLLGFALALRRPSRAAVLPLFVAAYLVSLLPFFVEGRYRLPLVPPLLVLAAAGLVWLEQAWRARRLRALLVGGLLVAGSTAVFEPDRWQVLMMIAVLGLGTTAAGALVRPSVGEVAEGA